MKWNNLQGFTNFTRMSSSSDDCPCNFCERFIANVGYI